MTSFETTWSKPQRYAVGGLCAVGFDASSQYLMVISSAGRGVFDCRTGERVARDDDDSWLWYRDDDATCDGLGPLQGTRIPMCGSGGQVETARALALSTRDGFTCESRTSDPRRASIVMTHNGTDSGQIDVEVLFAFGFSPDDRTFVLAESHTLTLVFRVE